MSLRNSRVPIAMAWLLVASTLAGAVIGDWLDRRFGDPGHYRPAGALFAVLGLFFAVICAAWLRGRE